MSREHQRPTSIIGMLGEMATSTPRPYTKAIGMNGKLRAQTMPIDERVQHSVATRTWPDAGREGRGERDIAAFSKSREDELVSFTGTWIPPSK